MLRRWSHILLLIGLAACRSTPEAGEAVSVPATTLVPAPVATTTPVPTPVVAVPVFHARIEARVRAGGAPVAGAEVHLSDGSQPTLTTALTDATGMAHFDDLEPGAYEIWARSAQQVSQVARVVRDRSEVVVAAELALVAGGAVHGKVTSDGALPAGTTVRLEPVGLDHATRQATLGAGGGFAIDGVPRGRWRVAADAPGYFGDADEVLAVGTTIVEVDVRLRRGGLLSGIVVDADGAPVKNATLVLRDQDGEFRAPTVGPPTAKLRWVHPLAGTRQMPRYEMSHFGAARKGLRPAECGRGHCGVDLGGKKGTPVHAAADGEVSKVVRAIHPEAGRYVVVEHASGVRTHYLHLEEIRDDLHVGMRLRAGDPLGTVGSTGASSAPHLHFALSQERQGRSYYVDAEPMLRHAVVLAEPRGLAWNSPEVGAPTVVASAGADVAPSRFTTDAQGAFHLEGIWPGEYVVAAFHPSLAPGASAAFQIRSGELTAGVSVTLSPGVAVGGRVLARGVPVAGARVVAEEGAGESSHRIATAYTDARGEYELHAVAGKVVLTASATGAGVAEREIDLGRGGSSRAQRREDFELVIEDAKLFGEVRDGSGRGVGGVTVRIVEGPTTRRRTTTDPTGSFLIAHVAPGAYVIELSSPDFPATRAELTSDRSGFVTLERGATVRIDLRDAHTGGALGRVQLDATGPGGRVLHPVTDAAGIALVRGLTPGSWTFRARAAGYAGVERTVEVGAGDLELRLELARGAVLAGVVRDAAGRRASGARVWIGDAETLADNDGNFRIADAPTGVVELRASLGDAAATLPLELRPGDERMTITLDLESL